MNIVFSLCDGKLASLSPIYIAIIVIMILSFITGLIITYNEKNTKSENFLPSSLNQVNNVNSSIVTTSSPINHFSTVSSITNEVSLVDNTIRIETLDEEPIIDTVDSFPKVNVLSTNENNEKEQDVTITYME